MITPSKPSNEDDRLHAVRALGLLDTPNEERFDRYTRFARRLFDVPIAFVSLMDDERMWFKSVEGIDAVEAPRDTSFCAHAILKGESLIVPDTLEDERFRDNPIVTDPPRIRFYVGVPLSTEPNLNVGTLCIADVKPRTLNPRDLQLLEDLSEMLQQEFSSQAIATTDELTGLSNRRGFRAIGQQAISMCLRLKRPAALMFFDLDRFKQVNDDHGHAEGDRVLRSIGQMMLREFRNSDVIARLGGDEFCVLLTGTNTEDIERPLQNLTAALKELNDEHPYEVGYSVGTVPLDADHHRNVDDLLLGADAAMYREKKARKEETRD